LECNFGGGAGPTNFLCQNLLNIHFNIYTIHD
jgi:hypothetical protein